MNPAQCYGPRRFTDRETGGEWTVHTLPTLPGRSTTLLFWMGPHVGDRATLRLNKDVRIPVEGLPGIADEDLAELFRRADVSRGSRIAASSTPVRGTDIGEVTPRGVSSTVVAVVCPRCKTATRLQMNFEKHVPREPAVASYPSDDELICRCCGVWVPLRKMRLAAEGESGRKVVK